MENRERRKDVLIMKINSKRKSIDNLQLILSAYERIKTFGYVFKKDFVQNNSSKTDIKIANIMESINFNVQILSSLETELSALESDDVKFNSN